MNHHHRKVLHSLFAHPVSSNINRTEVEAVLHTLGATLDRGHGGRLVVHLNGHTHGFAGAHHTLSKEEVAEVRKFLTATGVDPAKYPA
jgi:hypothetical protein